MSTEDSTNPPKNDEESWAEEEEDDEALYCTKHSEGPLDIRKGRECLQEVRDGPMPEDGRYTCEPLSSING